MYVPLLKLRAIYLSIQIHECLLFLVNRTETFLSRAQESQSHKTALNSILSTLKQELSTIEETPPPTLNTSTSSKANTQRRRTSSTHSPVRTRTTRRRSSGPEAEDVDPEQQLARNLGITLPPSSLPPLLQSQALEKTLTERLTKLEIHSNSLQTTTETSISSHLLDAHLTLQLLQDSLLAETLGRKVRLLDPDIEASVGMFESEIEELRGMLEGIDLTGLGARNVRREAIVERWGR